MPDTPEYPGTPRWVKLLGLVALAIVATIVAIHLAGGGFGHGHGGDAAPATGR